MIKTIGLVLLVLIMLVAFTACGAQEDEYNNERERDNREVNSSDRRREPEEPNMNDQMSAQEIAMFNRAWESYMGRPQRANQILAMINAVNVHNSHHEFAISVTGGDGDATIEHRMEQGNRVHYISSGRLSSENTYIVEATFNNVGRITSLEVSVSN
ncbi:MAG: hypothetical protein FWC79_04680 [Oscillospiraceae bacterium]|nr:hypothetical protein [Oscillospiraceae bacterium]